MTMRTIRRLGNHPVPYQPTRFSKFDVYPDIAQNLPRPTSKGFGPSSLSGLRGLGFVDTSSPGVQAAGAAIGLASMIASTYHGYKRNNSVGWAIWWGLMGGIFPIITPVIALAQGFGKRKGR